MFAPKDMVKPPRIALRPFYRPLWLPRNAGTRVMTWFSVSCRRCCWSSRGSAKRWQQNGGNFQTNIMMTSSNIHKLLAFLSSPLIHRVGNIQQTSWDWIMKNILGMANGLKQNSPTCQWWPDRPIILIHNHRLGTPVPQRMSHLHKPTNEATWPRIISWSFKSWRWLIFFSWIPALLLR